MTKETIARPWKVHVREIFSYEHGWLKFFFYVAKGSR
jgi:hypothetical protein